MKPRSLGLLAAYLSFILVVACASDTTPTATPSAVECTFSSAAVHAVAASAQVLTEDGNGTAFHLGEGVFMTAAHVVGDAATVILRSEDLETRARVVRIDFDADVATLEADLSQNRDFPSLDWGDSSALVVGQVVGVAGFPPGVEGDASIARGTVSRLFSIDGYATVQTDTAVNPGNSGGPLFDECGKAIGIVTAKLVDASIEGIGYAITESSARFAMDTLVRPPPSPVGATTPAGSGTPPSSGNTPQPAPTPSPRPTIQPAPVVTITPSPPPANPTPSRPPPVTSFGAGEHDVAPGYYRAPSATPGCALRIVGYSFDAASGAGDLAVLLYSNDTPVTSTSACGIWTAFTPQPMTSFGAGQHLGVVQVPAGYYRAPSASSGCALDLLGAPRASGAGDLTVLIAPNDHDWPIRSNSACGTWTKFSPQPITSFGAGQFYVDHQVQPGYYRASSASAGCELHATRGGVLASGAGDLIALINTGSFKVTSTPACGTWQRTPG